MSSGNITILEISFLTDESLLTPTDMKTADFGLSSHTITVAVKWVIMYKPDHLITKKAPQF